MLAKLVLFVLLCLAVYALFRGGKRIFSYFNEKETVVAVQKLELLYATAMTRKNDLYS